MTEFGPVTTEILSLGDFYFAEEQHQTYYAKHSAGSCGSQGPGVALLTLRLTTTLSVRLSQVVAATTLTYRSPPWGER